MWRLYASVPLDDTARLIRIAEKLSRQSKIYCVVPSADTEVKAEAYRRILERHSVDSLDDLSYMLDLVRICRAAGVRELRIYVLE